LTGPVTDVPREQEPDAADAPSTGAPGRQRRRRRLLVAGIAVAAALVAVALCAGVLGIVSAVTGVRDRATDARADQRQQDTACLELEQRLNRLTPPGATSTPQARASAIRDENAAVRIYVATAPGTRAQDGWRQLLDARTAYAEALDQQAKARTPAFFVAPKEGDGSAVADQLARWSPGSCAGVIRRLAAPDR
jgi:thioesterase domain-containing protein